MKYVETREKKKKSLYSPERPPSVKICAVVLHISCDEKEKFTMTSQNLKNAVMFWPKW